MKIRCAALVVLLATPDASSAQSTAQPPMTMQHQHDTASSPWHLMQDASLFLTANHQGGPRGGSDFGSQNWWMGMARRPIGEGTLTFNLMLSLDAATLGKDGYRELFQVGEALHDRPLIDRQHPHDVLMQAAAVWRVPLVNDFELTLAGAPVGEPALGPVAFMHRSSAAMNPTAPLSHHTLDSTHIAMEVLTAGLDRGPFAVQTSIFHGREPDENRWDLIDPGALDSWSIRGWYRPRPSVAVQASVGFLSHPEELEPGDVVRSTASVSWNRKQGPHATALTVAFGRNDKVDFNYNAFLSEVTHTFGAMTAFARFEALQVETDLLRFGVHPGSDPHLLDVHGLGLEIPASPPSTVQALTLGAARTVSRWSDWDIDAGADLTFYGVPTAFKATHGNHPTSFHVFIRVRPPAPMGRMVDGTMTRMMK